MKRKALTIVCVVTGIITLIGIVVVTLLAGFSYNSVSDSSYYDESRYFETNTSNVEVSVSQDGYLSVDIGGFSSTGSNKSQKSNSIPSFPKADVDTKHTIPSQNKTPIPNEHKVIYSGEIVAETLKFDEAVQQAKEYVVSIGGYAEDTYVEGKGINQTPRRAYFTFRVPQDKYESFFLGMRDIGVVVSEKSSGDDITEKYFDTEARLKMVKIQEERVLTLLEKADELKDVLELERELTEIRTTIESYSGTLRKWDNLVNFSTIKVIIREVEVPSTVVPNRTDSLWNRITFGFSNSIKALGRLTENLVVLLAGLLPFLVALSIPMSVFLFIRRAIRRRKMSRGKPITEKNKGKE